MDLLTPGFGLFIWTLIAFLAVFFILKKYAWKPILSALDEREKGIADSIATADKVRTEMAQLKAENEIITQQAREERTQMLREAKEVRDKMINDAKDIAKAEASKIIAEAQQQIENQKQAAMIDIKNQIGILAVEVAEKVLRKQLDTPQDHSAYAKLLAEDVKLN